MASWNICNKFTIISYVMNKKIKSTSEKFLESLNPKQLKEFNEGYKSFVLYELILALMEHDKVSVQRLTKIVGTIRSNKIS